MQNSGMLCVVTAMHVLFHFHSHFLLLLIIHYSFPSYSFSCSIPPFSCSPYHLCHLSCFVCVIIRSRILNHSLLCPVPNLLVVILIRVSFPLEENGYLHKLPGKTHLARPFATSVCFRFPLYCVPQIIEGNWVLVGRGEDSDATNHFFFAYCILYQRIFQNLFFCLLFTS